MNYMKCRVCGKQFLGYKNLREHELTCAQADGRRKIEKKARSQTKTSNLESSNNGNTRNDDSSVSPDTTERGPNQVKTTTINTYTKDGQEVTETETEIKDKSDASNETKTANIENEEPRSATDPNQVKTTTIKKTYTPDGQEVKETTTEIQGKPEVETKTTKVEKSDGTDSKKEKTKKSDASTDSKKNESVNGNAVEVGKAPSKKKDIGRSAYPTEGELKAGKPEIETKTAKVETTDSTDSKKEETKKSDANVEGKSEVETKTSKVETTDGTDSKKKKTKKSDANAEGIKTESVNGNAVEVGKAPSKTMDIGRRAYPTEEELKAASSPKKEDKKDDFLQKLPRPSHEDEKAYQQHQQNLVPCRHCKRKFNPERIRVHENSCISRPKSGIRECITPQDKK